MKKLLISLSLLFFGFYTFCLNHIGINQVGIARNSYNGDIWLQTKPEWYFTSPFVFIKNISTKPFVVSPLTRYSNNYILLAQKLVRFNPNGYKEFLDRQGFSFVDDIEDVLIPYAFSGKEWGFMDILSETKSVDYKNLNQ